MSGGVFNKLEDIGAGAFMQELNAQGRIDAWEKSHNLEARAMFKAVAEMIRAAIADEKGEKPDQPEVVP